MGLAVACLGLALVRDFPMTELNRDELDLELAWSLGVRKRPPRCRMHLALRNQLPNVLDAILDQQCTYAKREVAGPLQL